MCFGASQCRVGRGEEEEKKKVKKSLGISAPTPYGFFFAPTRPAARGNPALV